MEKQPLLSSEPAPPLAKQPPRPRHRFTLPIVLTLCIIASVFRHILLSPIRPPKPSPTYPDFNWDNAKAKSHFDYTPCYGGSFQCARLTVPMDYFNGTTDAKVHLAVIKKPAKVPVTHPQYGGPVLLNPGGPGGSGITLVLKSGEGIGKVVDTNVTSMAPGGGVGEGKYFDLISWDPRGVGKTLPRVSCAEDESVAWAWQMRVMEEGVLGSSDAGLGRLWSMAKARGGSCALPPSDGSADLKRYANTASSATDMISIIEAHGEWREKEAARLLGVPPPGQRGPKKRIQVPQRLKWIKGGEKLQYWGFSYGTYLGMSFSAMYPERVERVAVDGVVDPYDYRKALWYDNLIDTEKDMDQFYSNCARVGYPTCALANETGKTTSQGVKARADAITTHLYHNPLAVIGPNPEVITYSDVRNLVFGSLYSPIDYFPILATMLSDIEQGNGTRLAELLKPSHTPYCSSTNSPNPREWLSPDALNIISCTDGDSQANITLDKFSRHLNKTISLSPSIGAMWSTIRMECVHFPLRAFHRFTAPFAGKTASPMLFIGNTADPVTPGRNAINMAKAYEGAGAFLQDTPGHCSLSAASNCAVGFIRGYFQNGTLPPKGTVCKSDERPFGGGEGNDAGVMELKEVKGISKTFREGMAAAGGFARFGL